MGQWIHAEYNLLTADCSLWATAVQSNDYCKRGNFRATFIFALFTLQPGCAKIKAREYVQFVLRSM